MAKRKRLTPARIDDARADSAPALPASAPRPPLASPGRAPIADVAQDAATTAALMAVTQEMQSARREGRLIQRIPLDAIEARHLTRDRLMVDAEEMEVLKDSLRAKGQQTAIEVTELAPGRFGLISGWRRLTALRALSAENPEIDTILALVRSPKDAAEAYEAMVAENEIRSNLSFYERARIVVSAADAGAYRTDRLALSALFAAVPRARRSKIRAFVSVVRALEDVLRYPTALTEKLGLKLAAVVEADPAATAALRARLREHPADSAEAETQLLARLLDNRQGPTAESPAVPQPAQGPASAPVTPPSERLFGDVSLTIQADGRLVLQGRALKDPALVERVKQALRALD